MPATAITSSSASPPEPVDLLVQGHRQIRVARYQLQPVADAERGGVRRHGERAVLGRERLHSEVVSTADARTPDVDALGLPPGVDDRAIRSGARDDRRHERQRVLEPVDAARFPVEAVHQDRAARLDLGDAGDPRRGRERARAAARDDRARMAVRLDCAGRVDEEPDRLADRPRLLLGIVDLDEVTLPAHHARELEPLDRRYLARERHGRRAGRNACTVHADVELEHDADTRSGGSKRLAERPGLVGVIDGEAEVDVPAQSDCALDRPSPDDEVGDEEIAGAAGRHRLGLTELGTGQAVRTRGELTPRDRDRAMPFDVWPPTHARVTAESRHAVDVPLHRVEVDAERGRGQVVPVRAGRRSPRHGPPRRPSVSFTTRAARPSWQVARGFGAQTARRRDPGRWSPRRRSPRTGRRAPRPGRAASRPRIARRT